MFGVLRASACSVCFLTFPIIPRISYHCCGVSDVRRSTRRCLLLIVWTLPAPQHAQHLPPRFQGHQYFTAALSRRQRAVFQPHQHTLQKEEKQEYALLFVCVSIKVRAKEGEARSFEATNVWFLSSPTNRNLKRRIRNFLPPGKNGNSKNNY